MNQRYNIVPYKTFDYGKSILQQGNSFIVHGETFNQYGQRTIVTIKIDSVGELKWIKTIGSDTEVYASGFPGSLFQSTGNKYYCAANRRAYTTNWVHDRGLLIKFNEEFDTLWSKEFGDQVAPYDTAFIFWNINRTSDGNIILTGTRKPYAIDPKVYLVKTDTSGNKLWENVYTNLPGDVQGYSVVATTDGGFAIGAFQYYHVPPPNETGDPLVIKTDSLGNFQWVRNLGGDLMDTHAMLANSADGNILAVSAYSDSVSGGDEWAKKIHLVKLSNDNQVIFDRKYNRKIYMLFTHTVQSNPDGTIICSGSTGTINSDYPFTVGWLMKMDSNGDSLWYREYQKVGRPNSFSSNVLYNVIPTSDNGYIACGYVNPVLPDTGTQDIWVVKVDSLGCESPSYCWVSVKELTVAPKLGELIVFPNPAKEVFTVQFKPLNQKNLLQFVDVMGRKVEEISIDPFEETRIINCSHWPQGIYLGQLVCDDHVVAKGKVVVR